MGIETYDNAGSPLSGNGVVSFLNRCEALKCVFDTGNFAFWDEDEIEYAKILSDKVMHVHLKDRDESGKNVVPGRGKVNFEPIMKALYEMQYTGLLITETDRGNDPLSTAIDNKKFFLKE